MDVVRQVLADGGCEATARFVHIPERRCVMFDEKQLREAAQSIVRQWDEHGRFRVCAGESDDEPAEVAVARAYLSDLDAAEAEIERLREEAVELHETILLAEGFMVRNGEMSGWIDSCCMTDAVLSGDRLVELGIYERHPNRAGRRSFYRRKDAQSRTALENEK